MGLRHRSRSMNRKFKAGSTPSLPMLCHCGPLGVMIQYLPFCLTISTYAVGKHAVVVVAPFAGRASDFRQRE